MTKRTSVTIGVSLISYKTFLSDLQVSS